MVIVTVKTETKRIRSETTNNVTRLCVVTINNFRRLSEPISIILKKILNTAWFLLAHHNSRGVLILIPRRHIHQVNAFQDIFHWKFNTPITLSKSDKTSMSKASTWLFRMRITRIQSEKAVYTRTKSISVTWAAPAYGKVTELPTKRSATSC